jgi:ribonucleoside-triphosphate reductase (formate)
MIKEPILSYYPEDFQKIISNEMNKYSVEYLSLLGLGKWLDPHYYSKNFFNKENPEITIDINANAANNTMQNYLAEFNKAHLFLNNLYLIYKELKKKINQTDISIEKVFENIFNGNLYIHDKHHFGQLPYCYAYDCMDWVISGIPKDISKAAISKPAKHFDSFLQHTENLIIYFSNSSSGAVALPNLFPVLDWYIRNDLKNGYLKKSNYIKKIKQRLQSFIFNLNQATRVSNQSPFTNLSFLDKIFMKKLFKDITFPDGTTYNEDSTIKLQELFMEVFEEVYTDCPMTFPVMTAAVAKDEKNNILDTETFKKILKINMHRGVFNWLVSLPNSFSSCCRLKNELEDENYITNSFGSGGVKIGSLGVVTLVLPNIFLNKSSIEEVTLVAKTLLRIKRALLQKRINQKKLPLYTLGWVRLQTQYQTIGVTGLNEYIDLNKKSIKSEAGIDLAKQVLDAITLIKKQDNIHSDMFNIEYVPAENAGVKMAELTKSRGLHNYNIFSNQIVPHDINMDIFNRIDIYGKIDGYFSGGNIFHANLDTLIKSAEKWMDLILYISQSGVTYFSFNILNGVCEEGHHNFGIKLTEEPKCKKCGKKIVEYYDRIVGYQAALSSFSEARLLHDYYKRFKYNAKKINVDI